MRHILLPLLVLLTASQISGCATLNEDECRHANWRIIGMDDGAKGRNMDYVARHNEACAEYGIRPDLERYRSGHAEGLRLYCTEPRGYEVGKRGSRYSGICPPALEGEFLAGYRLGRRYYETRQERDRLQGELKENDEQLETCRERQQSLNAHLVAGEGERQQRAEWLAELEDEQRRERQLRHQRRELRESLASAEARLERLAR